MRNTLNWILVACGGILIVAELLLGAVTGFDLALIGVSLVAGGGIGLFFESTKIGLFSSGALALLYFAFFRRRIRSHLTARERPTNVDALLGRAGVVTARLAAGAAGRVKISGEEWRAVLAPGAGPAREPGEQITVESVDGVTLTVR